MRSHVRTILVSFSAVLVIVAGSVVGTNLVTAEPASSPGPVTVTFNYNGATGGNSVTAATVTSGTQANTVLPLPTKPGASFTGWFNTQSLLNGQRITIIEENDAGELLAGFIPPELAQTLNLVLPTASCAEGGACVLGSIGPGGGLVFLIDGITRYEMAPKSWSGGVTDPTSFWCNVDTRINSAVGTAVGTGEANTTAMRAVCASGAGNLSAAYRGGGFDDWFLPSQDELNAMCNYSRNPDSPAPPSASCRGSAGTDQDDAFALGLYGFAANDYRSSTQAPRDDFAFVQYFADEGGDKTDGFKSNLAAVRPVRAF